MTDADATAGGRGLSEADVEHVLDTMTTRDAERGRDARHVYETLTWGEGPATLSQARLQNWLWYQLPTKYLIDEDDYEQRLAGIAGELFDRLGLDRYAAICRSDTTAAVHAAFRRTDGAGYTAMRKAAEASGIEPPDIDGFAWGSTMGGEEAAARSTAEHALEAAIETGRLRVGASGWRDVQAAIVAEAIDRDHPTLPGQSLRTVVFTERAERWRDHFARLAPTLAPIADRVVKGALATPDPPSAEVIATAFHPLLWLLEHIGGDGQAVTQTGNLNRAFVVEVWKQRPWTDELLPLDKPPRSESDDFILHALRGFAQRAGLARVTKRMLRRTKLGDRVLADPSTAWNVVVSNLGARAWERFIAETAAMLLLANDSTMDSRLLEAMIAELAGELGWRTDGLPPTDRDVAHGFGETRRLLRVFGMVAPRAAWNDFTDTLTGLGTQLATGLVHRAATGPRSHP